jgi:hypothetical protein
MHRLESDATIQAYLAAGLAREPLEQLVRQVRVNVQPLLVAGDWQRALALTAEMGERALADVRAERRRLAMIEPVVECGPGCASCCELRVEVLPLEAQQLARRAQELGLLEEASERATKVGQLSKLERLRTRTPCVFLDSEGRCRAHTVRPLACRAANSLSRATCRVNVEQALVDAALPVDAIWLVLLRAARVGLQQACDDAGIASDLNELHTALTRSSE